MNNLRTVFTTVLTALLLCVTGSAVYAQAVITKVFPPTSSFESDLVAPNGLTAHTALRTHFIIPASEIGLPAGTIIKSIGFKYAGGTDVAAGGNIIFYLQNTVNTANAKPADFTTSITPMQHVYSGAFELPVGVMDEAETAVAMQTPFTYTGGGLYVAYSYAGTSFANIPARTTINQVQANSLRYEPSIGVAPASLTNLSSYRPQVVLGYDNPVTNDLEVRSIRSNAIAGKALTGPNQVTATVRNNSNQELQNISVTMQVTGVNTASSTETIPAIAAGDSAEVVFVAPTTGSGIQQITVAVPADAENTNNSFSYAQLLDCETLQYVSDQYGYGSIGFPGGSGIMAIKFPVNQVPIKVDGLTFRVSLDPGNVGETVTALIIDEYNNILTSSDPFTIEASMLGTDQVIPFTAPVSFLAGEVFYAGIAQESGTNLPVGSAYPNKIAAGTAYFFDIAASTSTESTANGTFMIGLKAVPYLEFSSSVAGQILEGTQVMYVASPGFTHYDFKVNGVSKYSGIDNYFIYYPENGDDVTLEASNNDCSYTAPDHFVMDVSPVTPGAGNILYVNRHAGTLGDGSSWEGPIGELSDALRWAKARQANFTTANPLKIYVAGGTYKPMYSAVDETFGMDGGPNNAFLMVKNVQIYGGFQGTESSPAERDLSVVYNKSILSGDYSDDDYFTGDAQTLSFQNMFENAFHIVISSGDVGNALMDGFTITGGGGELFGMPYEIVNGNQINPQYGGGIYIQNSSPHFSNLIIVGNKADLKGGGVYANTSSAAITSSLLFKNLAGSSGGAVFNDVNADLFLTNLTITHNRAITSGGSIANNNAAPAIRNTVIHGNNSGISNASGTPQIMYSLVQGLAADATNHNLDGTVDPLFNDAPADDYTLRSSSSVINRGSNLYFQAGQSPDLSYNTKDLNSKDRIQENTIDIGAYEAKPSLSILQHPVDLTSCQGTEVNFVTLVNSSGISSPSYQWQQSTDGNSWTNIEGATEFTYLLKASINLQFRCIVGIPGYSITTLAAVLTTTPFAPPVITMPDRLCLNENTVQLKASPEGGIFNGDGVSEGSWSLLNFKAGPQTIRYTYTAPNGCQGTVEKEIILESCTSDSAIKLFRSQPNPTRGLISVKIVMGQEIREAQLIISSIHGQQVVRKPVKLSRGTNLHQFDLSGYGAGIYFVIIYNESKKPLASISLIKQ